ncbi:GTP 3',8-cyclase MoaA [Campylobacter canadensis]|uniref:GTP 3',8-cyclase n=1 Tax=Campylobacter canadensis TaxID=449520 RepID=A0ABS7WQR6_9BACT|nr:GTP 3',8-cyclase MoaA [Campylobacter canadensis]MBZ7987100.1 GTP 3',8-cyclase MoaA [Campylobacter canadensis]MBZ7994714.1 GTP 3',8-cyclase MoaA [Campylobacter canadensis]MBZ7996210.1 GTP 3',8-cyclase MoaA [Campylobacter canadensis]MBZ7998136.1 GTP 3',8-cyclase MoaA [Campylobacter canadensis]MBZ7999974.1 GTP 3',8-cyclase MoaA [Campylobacter canadensis]
MLIDGYGRKINYLRISLTQRCNFRCLYCMPKVPFTYQAKENLLSYEELFLFAKLCIDKGVDKIRLTGGEPLVRSDLEIFIKMLTDYKSDLDLALTTNGYLLKDKAKALKDAGLKRINVSLDTLKPQRAKLISQIDMLDVVIDGINEALKVGLKVKLNCVPLKNINDDELCDLLEFAKSKNMQIRFIEFMENEHAYGQLKGLDTEEIITILKKKFNFTPSFKEANSPASLFCLDDGYIFGIINPHKHDFCESCNRIRLSAEGFLIPCLYFDEAMSIKNAIRNNDINKALEILNNVLENKPEKNRWQSNIKSARSFSQTGG